MIMRLMRLLEKFIKVKKNMINNLVDNSLILSTFYCVFVNVFDKISVGGIHEKISLFNLWIYL